MWARVNAPRRRTLPLVLVTALVLLLAACSGGGDEPSAAPRTAAPSESPAPPPPPPPVDPITGTPPLATAPLVAVKIDNSPLARPFHRGLDVASLTYLELVEGGATRMMALYSQAPDVEIGPVRSFRESDIEILQQYGKPGVSFSGANGGTLATFRQAVAAGQMVEVSYDTHPALFRLAERRSDARNFFTNPARLAAAAPGAQPAKDMGWLYDAAPRADALPGNEARIVFSDRETWTVRYDAASGRYAVLTGGQPLTGAVPANVIVQQVQVRPTRYRDTTGAVTPYSSTVGTGPLQLLRDGTVIGGTWNRPDPASPTQFLDGAGAPLALRPGPTWILLQPAGLPFSAG